MIFDVHSDIWTDVTARRLRGETDVLRKHHLPRLQAGNVEGSIFVIWVDPPYEADPAARTRDIMAAIRAEVIECDDIAIVHNYEEMMAARTAGKFYVFIGIEGLSAIGCNSDNLEEYHILGARHAMLSWNEENALATGVKGDPDRGLTESGRKTVEAIQLNKMLLDVSHLNEKSFWDVIKAAQAPICASHSNAKALCSVARNLSDEQLRAIRDLDGVVGLNSFHLFVHEDPAQQTVANLARHAAHMVDVMGIEHVGCGFDFFEFLPQDTMSAMTSIGSPACIGMEDASKSGVLFAELKKLGMSQRELELIARENFQTLVKKTIR